VKPLVTARVALDEVPRAFEELARPDAQVKVIVEPTREPS
jgi:threonine dehydrogenase-like Zn-dependent dehydrogenase